MEVKIDSTNFLQCKIFGNPSVKQKVLHAFPNSMPPYSWDMDHIIWGHGRPLRILTHRGVNEIFESHIHKDYKIWISRPWKSSKGVTFTSSFWMAPYFLVCQFSEELTWEISYGLIWPSKIDEFQHVYIIFCLKK